MEAWLLPTGSDRGGHVCRRNVVILDSPCQAISLIMALIWNVGLWFIFLPILPPSPPNLPHKVVSSTSITIARGNLSILLAHPPSLYFRWHLAASACHYRRAPNSVHPQTAHFYLWKFEPCPMRNVNSEVYFLPLFPSVMESLGSGFDCYFWSSWMFSRTDMGAADSTPPWPSASGVITQWGGNRDNKKNKKQKTTGSAIIIGESIW